MTSEVQEPGAAPARPLAVIDIDGVLADVRHRLHHVAGSPKDWARFFAAAPDDPVLPQGIEAARRLAEVCEVVYLSGRPEQCRAATVAWLHSAGAPPGTVVLRRPGDRRPARLVKVQALRRLSSRAPVTVLVDDDVEVCHAARAAGFDVLVADWMGEPAATLREAQQVDGRT